MKKNVASSFRRRRSMWLILSVWVCVYEKERGSVCECVTVCVCVCVCVCDRKRGRERLSVWLCPCVCVREWVKERESVFVCVFVCKYVCFMSYIHLPCGKSGLGIFSIFSLTFQTTSASRHLINITWGGIDCHLFDSCYNIVLWTKIDEKSKSRFCLHHTSNLKQKFRLKKD